MRDELSIRNVLVTGATGFVGGYVVRELLVRGLTPVCLVRSAGKLFNRHPRVTPNRLVPVIGALNDLDALREAAGRSEAAVHLAGIIIQRTLKGKTFDRVHRRGTENILQALAYAGIRRYVHMSALGTRPKAATAYHRTKWAGELSVRDSGLDWTVFRPSLIHGPDGEFMRLMRRFMCGLVPPVIPYFGPGTAKLQPVFVKDVAYCLVEALFRPQTIGQTYPLGGPKMYTWLEFYNMCRALMPRASRWKPIVSLPVPLAKLLATLSAPPMALAELIVPSLGMMRFDRGQVDMAQDDCLCDPEIAQAAFEVHMRSFEEALPEYAEQIR